MDWQKGLEVAGILFSGSVLTVLTGFILKLRRQGWQQYQQDKQLDYNRDSEEITNVLNEYKLLFNRFKKELESVGKEIEELREEHIKCREDSAELRGQIKLLEFKLSKFDLNHQSKRDS